MATYQKDDGEIKPLADELIAAQEHLKWIKDCKLNIDYVFAYGTRDDDGKLIGDAIKQHGVKALGLCKVVSLKDRAKGLGDAEILIDHDWWEKAGREEAKAVLHHELYHLKPTAQTDDLGRPKLKLRKHDWFFGWFDVIAKIHGEASQERKQAKTILDQSGQYYWAELAATVTIEANGLKSQPMEPGRFSQIAKDMTPR